jgi:hypothetical protein
VASKAVAPIEAPSVPALAPTPATTISAEDIVVPRLYVGNGLSKAVKRKRAGFGDVYLAAGPDDPEANVLWQFESQEPGVLAHVLHLLKRKSWSQPGGELFTWDFEDPNAHEDAWTTYNYTLFLPEVDPDMPAKLLLAKSGKGVAMRVNTVLARNNGPLWSSAFRITSTERQKDDKEWAVFEFTQTTADPKHVAQAASLYELIAPGLANQAQRQSNPNRDEPGI